MGGRAKPIFCAKAAEWAKTLSWCNLGLFLPLKAFVFLEIRSLDRCRPGRRLDATIADGESTQAREAFNYRPVFREITRPSVFAVRGWNDEWARSSSRGTREFLGKFDAWSRTLIAVVVMLLFSLIDRVTFAILALLSDSALFLLTWSKSRYIVSGCS